MFTYIMALRYIYTNTNKEVVACVSILESSSYTILYRYQRYKPLRTEDDPKPSSPSEAPNLKFKPLPSTIDITYR